MDNEDLVTIIGPSKTESMSGFRLGAAFGSRSMIQRMEKLPSHCVPACRRILPSGHQPVVQRTGRMDGGTCSCASGYPG